MSTVSGTNVRSPLAASGIHNCHGVPLIATAEWKHLPPADRIPGRRGAFSSTPQGQRPLIRAMDRTCIRPPLGPSPLHHLESIQPAFQTATRGMGDCRLIGAAIIGPRLVGRFHLKCTCTSRATSSGETRPLRPEPQCRVLGICTTQPVEIRRHVLSPDGTGLRPKGMLSLVQTLRLERDTMRQGHHRGASIVIFKIK